MKTFLKKSSLIGIGCFAALLIVFFLDLNLLQYKPYKSDVLVGLSIFQVGSIANSSIFKIFPDVYVLSLVMDIAFFVQLIPLGLLVFSYFKKNNIGFIVSIIYSLAFQIYYLFYIFFYNIAAASPIGVLVSAFIFVLVAFALYFLRRVFLKRDYPKEGDKETEAVEEKPKNAKGLALGILIIDIIQIVGLLTMIFIPLYSLGTGTLKVNYTIISGLTLDTNSNLGISYFSVVMAFVFMGLFFFASLFSYFFSSKDKFVEESKTLTYLNLVFTLAFFFIGFFTSYFFAKKSQDSSTNAYIPLIIEGVMALVYSVFKGLYDKAVDYQEVTESLKPAIKPLRLEPLIYIFVLSLLTCLSLFLNVIIIKLKCMIGTTVTEFKYTGLKLLTDYANLGSGYQLLACYLVIMLVVTSFCFLWTATSYFSHYKHYGAVVKASAYANVFLMFLLGASGFYLTIGSEINKRRIN